GQLKGRSKPIPGRGVRTCAWRNAPKGPSRDGEGESAAARGAGRLCAVAGDLAPSGAQALRRARTRADARPRLRSRIRTTPARAEHMEHARSRREDRARAAPAAAARCRPRPAPRSGSSMTMASAARRVPAPVFPERRAPLVFGVLLVLFGLLAGRSRYRQRIACGFLQEQGSSRYSRNLEVPAHRGRILDRSGDPLAISTPVKAIWAWPDKVEATPAQLSKLAATLDLAPAALSTKLS